MVGTGESLSKIGRMEGRKAVDESAVFGTVVAKNVNANDNGSRIYLVCWKYICLQTANFRISSVISCQPSHSGHNKGKMAVFAFPSITERVVGQWLNPWRTHVSVALCLMPDGEATYGTLTPGPRNGTGRSY
jgi:hypothetical protein